MDILDSRIDWRKCLVKDKRGIHKVVKFIPWGGQGEDVHLIYYSTIGADRSSISVDEEGIGHKACCKGNAEYGRVLFTLKDDNFCTPPDLNVEYEENGDKVKILNIEGWESYKNLPNSYNYSDCHMDVYGEHLYLYNTFIADSIIDTALGAKDRLYKGKTLTRREFKDAMALAKRAKENYIKIKETIYG